MPERDPGIGRIGAAERALAVRDVKALVLADALEQCAQLLALTEVMRERAEVSLAPSLRDVHEREKADLAQRAVEVLSRGVDQRPAARLRRRHQRPRSFLEHAGVARFVERMTEEEAAELAILGEL